MGDWKATEAAYYAPEEKVITEKNKMCMAQALITLHTFRDLCRSHVPDSELADALDAVFEWVDEAVLLSKRTGK